MILRKLGLFPQNTKINFLKYHKLCFLFSFILVVFFIVYPFFFKVNLGIDFKGGVVVEVKPNNNVAVQTVKQKILTLKDLDIGFQQFQNSKNLQITISNTSLSKFSNKSEVIDTIRSTLKGDVIIVKSEFIGPNISGQLVKGGIISFILALLGIMLYVALRFNLSYGAIAVITLIHDAIIGVGFVILFNYEINNTTIAAALTIIGYSINDTIITFNQVKENIGRYTKMSNLDLLNQSLNDVISRTVSTSLTVILVLLSMYLFGGNTLTSFSFTLLIGVIFGTYSSIFLSVPALLYIENFRNVNKGYKNK